MRSDEERILLLHRKAQKLHYQKMMRTFGAVTACLLIALVTVIVKVDIPLQSLTGNGLAASSLLGEEAGGYVLVAVISFVAAVCLTVYCIKRRNRKTWEDKENL